jgi:anti-sigma factor ChrR (cupin superfamily)
MKHEEAAPLLPDLHRGVLEGAERDEVESHLGECEECAALYRTYRTVHAALVADAGVSTDHPSVDEIVAYATRRDRLDEDASRRIATHLGRCVACAEEVRRTERADVFATPSMAEFRRRSSATEVQAARTTRILALAAAFLAAVLLYPAFLGMFRVPELREQAETLAHSAGELESDVRDLSRSLEDARATSERLRDWSGAVGLNLLSSTFRGSDDPPRVKVAPSEPFVVFGVEMDLPETVSDSDVLLFRFTDERGTAAAEIRLPAAQARQAKRSAGVVTMVVPSERLDVGRYRLDVTAPAHPRPTRVLSARFDVARTDAP